MRSLAMQSVSKTFVAPRGTPADKKRNFSDNGNFKTMEELLQYMLVCIIILVKFPKSSEFMQSYLINPKRLLNAHMMKSTNSGVPSIEAFFKKPVTSVMIVDFFKSKVEELFKADSSKKFGFTFNSIDLWFELKPEFFSFFEEIAGEMLNPESGKTSKSEQMMRKITKNQEGSIKVLPVIKEATIDEIQSHNDAFSKILEEQSMNHRENFKELVGFLPPSRSRVEIFAQNTVIFYDHLQSVHKPSVPAPVPVSQQVTSNLADHPVNDTTELVSAVVNDLFNQAITNVIDKSAKAIGAGNQAALSHIFGEDSDVNALKEEVARQAAIEQSVAITDASAALEVAGLVNTAAKADESVFLDPLNLNPLARSVEPNTQPSPPVTIDYVPVSPDDYFSASPEIQSLKNVTHGGDTDSVALFAAISSSIPPLSGQHQSDPQSRENGASGHLCVMSEGNRNGADQSGDTSPHSPDGEGRAHFTTSAQSPPKGVEDRALGAQHKSSLRNLGSTSSSGQNGTFLTHDFPDLLASLAISSKSSFTPPTNQIVPSPELTDTGVGGARFSDIQSKNVLSHVGVRGNPHTNQPSFSPQGNGGPPVQELAKLGKPPSGDSSGADHPETPSTFNPWSSCIPGGKTRSSTQRQTPKLSGWRNFFRRDKSSNRVNPSQGETGDTSPQVTHSSDKISSEFAATTTTLLPSSISPLGGNIGGNPGAHSPGDPPGFVPPSAPSSSSELGSAAATAANPLNEKPPTRWGVDIGGIERTWVRSEFDEVEFLVLRMQYAKAQPPPPLLWTHPCLLRVPNLARLARVA